MGTHLEGFTETEREDYFRTGLLKQVGTFKDKGGTKGAKLFITNYKLKKVIYQIAINLKHGQYLFYDMTEDKISNKKTVKLEEYLKWSDRRKGKEKELASLIGWKGQKNKDEYTLECHQMRHWI